MRHTMEIDNLQELIVNRIKEQSANDKYLTASDLEYRINEALEEIAALLVRMVTK